MSVDFPIRRFTVDEYHRMIQAGILTDEDPIELLDGFLVAKVRKTPPHCVAKRLVADVLQSLIRGPWFVDAIGAITTADSEPEPDISIVRGDFRDYCEHHPFPSDIALVVEVADSSLSQDRGMKKTIYARVGIAHYWILNLIDRQLETFADPTGPTAKPDFRTTAILGPTDLVPLFVDGNEIGRWKVADLLP